MTSGVVVAGCALTVFVVLDLLRGDVGALLSDGFAFYLLWMWVEQERECELLRRTIRLLSQTNDARAYAMEVTEVIGDGK